MQRLQQITCTDSSSKRALRTMWLISKSMWSHDGLFKRSHGFWLLVVQPARVQEPAVHCPAFIFGASQQSPPKHVRNGPVRFVRRCASYGAAEALQYKHIFQATCKTHHALQDVYKAHPLPGKLPFAPPQAREQKPFEGDSTYNTTYKDYGVQPRELMSPRHELRTHSARPRFHCMSSH